MGAIKARSTESREETSNKIHNGLILNDLSKNLQMINHSSTKKLVKIINTSLHKVVTELFNSTSSPFQLFHQMLHNSAECSPLHQMHVQRRLLLFLLLIDRAENSSELNP